MAARVELSSYNSGAHFDFDGLIARVEKVVANQDDGRIGYTGVDSVLNGIGLGNSSAEGKTLAAALLNLIMAAAYRRSAELAEAANQSSASGQQVVSVQRKFDASMKLTDQVVDTMELPINIDEILFAANREWDHALYLGEKFGWQHDLITVHELSEPDCDSCNIRMYPVGSYYMCGICGDICRSR